MKDTQITGMSSEAADAFFAGSTVSVEGDLAFHSEMRASLERLGVSYTWCAKRQACPHVITARLTKKGGGA